MGVTAGCSLALAARPLLLGPGGRPSSATVLLFLVLLGAGLVVPLPTRPRRQPGLAPPLTVLAIGMAAFTAGRLLGGDHPLVVPVGGALLVNSLAAVAEEAFYRRFVYGLLEGRGPAVAVAGSAALFAAVHLTVYGAWVVPLDLAAGLVFSWQRWACGSWGVPAATHVWANVLAVR